MSIDTGDHPPIAKEPYTLALKHYNWLKEEIEKLLEAGVIRESHSSWSVLCYTVIGAHINRVKKYLLVNNQSGSGRQNSMGCKYAILACSCSIIRCES